MGKNEDDENGNHIHDRHTHTHTHYISPSLSSFLLEDKNLNRILLLLISYIFYSQAILITSYSYLIILLSIKDRQCRKKLCSIPNQCDRKSININIKEKKQ